MKIIVTGAASGIGRAAAIRLQQDVSRRDGRPAELLLVDINAELLADAAVEVAALGARVETFVGDLANAQVPGRAVETAANLFGGLDVLVSNAGILRRGSLLETTLEDYDLTFAVNTRATWLLSKAAFPMLAASKGCLIATASISGYEPTGTIGAYSASKAALLMLVKQLASDWGPLGIRCNTVSPGSTRTALTHIPGVGAPERRVGRNPLRMIAEPEQQAAAIAFLASPDAAFITGADLLVDGGASTQLMATSGMENPWQA